MILQTYMPKYLIFTFKTIQTNKKDKPQQLVHEFTLDKVDFIKA